MNDRKDVYISDPHLNVNLYCHSVIKLDWFSSSFCFVTFDSCYLIDFVYRGGPGYTYVCNLFANMQLKNTHFIFCDVSFKYVSLYFAWGTCLLHIIRETSIRMCQIWLKYNSILESFMNDVTPWGGDWSSILWWHCKSLCTNMTIVWKSQKMYVTSFMDNLLPDKTKLLFCHSHLLQVVRI